VDKFESEVIDWVKSADSLKTITLTGVNVKICISKLCKLIIYLKLSSEPLKDAKRQAKCLWLRFNELCITMLSLNLTEVKPETATKMRATALLIRAKMILAKKKLANFPKENVKPPVSASIVESSNTIYTPQRETVHNTDFESPSTSGYSSARSDAVSSFTSSFQDNVDFADRPPTLMRKIACYSLLFLKFMVIISASARPSGEVNYMSEIYQQPSPASKKNKLALDKQKDKFHDKFINHAEDAEFQGFNFPHSQQTKKVAKTNFYSSRTDQYIFV